MKASRPAQHLSPSQLAFKKLGRLLDRRDFRDKKVKIKKP